MNERLQNLQQSDPVNGWHGGPRLPPSLLSVLTPKQSRFVYAWVRTRSAAKAARDAGYGPKYAESAASAMLQSSGVKAAIDWLLKRLDPDQPEWVIEQLRRVHDVATAAVPVLDRQGNPTGKYKTDLNAANRALELIGKHLGLFDQRVEVIHKGEIHHLLQAVAARGKPRLEERRGLTSKRGEREPVTHKKD